jgi:signal transduction histidine kinase
MDLMGVTVSDHRIVALNDKILVLNQQLAHRSAQLGEARTLAHEEVASLLQRLVAAQEDERARIARDLHDQLGQQLTVLRLTLERGEADHVPRSSSSDAFTTALALVEKIQKDVDFLGWQLRPGVLDELGLSAALPRFVAQWAACSGLRAEYRGATLAEGQLSKDAEVTFYRVTQEALNNVAKHAAAQRVDVVLAATTSDVTLVIEDDGIGFDPGALAPGSGGFGLRGMRERAALVGATLQVESAPGEGTGIFLRCPAAAADGRGGG